MEQLKLKLAQILAHDAPTPTTPADERCFPFLDEETSSADTWSCAAPAMSRVNAGSGFLSSDAVRVFPCLTDHVQGLPLEPSPSLYERNVESLMSPKQQLVEMMAMHDMLHVPPTPPPSPVIEELPNQQYDWQLSKDRWNDLLSSLLPERSTRC